MKRSLFAWMVLLMLWVFLLTLLIAPRYCVSQDRGAVPVEFPKKGTSAQTTPEDEIARAKEICETIKRQQEKNGLTGIFFAVPSATGDPVAGMPFVSAASVEVEGRILIFIDGKTGDRNVVPVWNLLYVRLTK